MRMRDGLLIFIVMILAGCSAYEIGSLNNETLKRLSSKQLSSKQSDHSSMGLLVGQKFQEQRIPVQQFHTEEYDRIYESRFLSALSNPLSTFSIDVDTASYSNIRRFINASQFPPPDAVRIEEMIN